jgi:hypothetical protein
MSTTSGIPALATSRSSIELGLTTAPSAAATAAAADAADADAGTVDTVAAPLREWLAANDVTSPNPSAYAHATPLSRASSNRARARARSSADQARARGRPPPGVHALSPNTMAQAGVLQLYRDLLCLLDLVPMPSVCSGPVRAPPEQRWAAMQVSRSLH